MTDENILQDLLYLRNEINRILGQREENMKFYGMSNILPRLQPIKSKGEV